MNAPELQPTHRSRRFFASLSGAAPAEEDAAWAEGWLSDHERAAFRKMPPADRRHSVAVARAVVAHLDRLGLTEADPDARWIVGPSITGSEKGTPTSTASAPASATARTTSTQSSP